MAKNQPSTKRDAGGQPGKGKDAASSSKESAGKSGAASTAKAPAKSAPATGKKK